MPRVACSDNGCSFRLQLQLRHRHIRVLFLFPKMLLSQSLSDSWDLCMPPPQCPQQQFKGIVNASRSSQNRHQKSRSVTRSAEAASQSEYGTQTDCGLSKTKSKSFHIPFLVHMIPPLPPLPIRSSFQTAIIFCALFRRFIY